MPLACHLKSDPSRGAVLHWSAEEHGGEASGGSNSAVHRGLNGRMYPEQCRRATALGRWTPRYTAGMYRALTTRCVARVFRDVDDPLSHSPAALHNSRPGRSTKCNQRPSFGFRSSGTSSLSLSRPSAGEDDEATPDRLSGAEDWSRWTGVLRPSRHYTHHDSPAPTYLDVALARLVEQGHGCLTRHLTTISRLTVLASRIAAAAAAAPQCSA
ncbi:hypothetical protein CMUS01_03489 [Colletotrichum musicola]|uniref:Uncharacterized protein n=1 Tax=Colletotrichum musicola TaxID=2175873 RepID=A0A8H6NS99_9PEZI|nr:hypothetical protein CMUS01_03489 [Colletotrichum musicola]